MSLVSHRERLLRGGLEVEGLSMYAFPRGQSATGDAISKPGSKIGFIPTLRVMSRFGKHRCRICEIGRNAHVHIPKGFPVALRHVQ